MKSTKNNIEAEVILEFEKIKPAITRLLQSESNNKNLILRLGKSSSENSNEVTINPTILVNSIENSNINKKDVLIGTVVHESIHSINEYEINPEIDFFPLTVNYQEKFYSVGKIPGGFFKREGRPTEKDFQ